MDMSQERALVIGTGISGIGAARLLARKGAGVTLYDEKEDIDIEGIRGRLGIDGVEIVAGVLPEAIDRAVTLLVISPGVPVDAPIVNRYRDRGIRIIGEIELAYSCARGRLTGITGTNGKTTTTSLVGAMMRDYFGNAYVVGNIGNPYTDIAMDTDEASVTVAEISSFQLETIETFRPNVSAILNITPDHLNRHHTMECYVETKEAIARFQTGEDYCVLNYENEYTRDFGERCPSRVVFFSSERVLENGFYLVNEDIYYSRNGVSQRIMNIYDMNLVGMCNIENVMAALAIGSCMGIPFETLLKTIREFKAVAHRIEFVATKRGVDYYNDSKGTTPDAAIQGIRAMRKPTILIGGGYDKGSTYDEWIEAFDGKVKKLILIGQTRDKIAACARAHGFEDILFAESLEEVMRLCVELSVPGDAVLLSPACASWGMFPNYEVRGKLFKDFVYKIEE